MFNKLIDILKNAEMIVSHGFYHDGRFHSVKMIKGKPYREVVEVLVLKGDEIFISYRPDNPVPQFPCGSTEPSKTIFDTAYAECQEEARLTTYKINMVTDKKNNYIKQLINPDRPKWKKEYNGFVNYAGKYVHVVVAKYKEQYTGDIDKRDVHKMAETGKFCKILDELENLNKYQLNALATFCINEIIEENRFIQNINGIILNNNIIPYFNVPDNKSAGMESNKSIIRYYYTEVFYGNLLNLIECGSIKISTNKNIAKHYKKAGRRTTGVNTKLQYGKHMYRP